MIDKKYKYYDLVMAAFVTVLITANIIGPAKISQVDLPLIGTITFGAGVLFFPISYIFGDILTEVYGYARARKVIWAGFGAMIFATFMSQIVIHMPVHEPEPFNAVLQPALEIVFGSTGRIVIASIVAFWAGDFVNAYVLAKMKILTSGRYLWTRTIGSTMVGQSVDSLIFYPVAFYGVWSTEGLIAVVLFNFAFKVSIEIIMTPVTYKAVSTLKKLEDEDYYDVSTDFSPFKLDNK